MRINQRNKISSFVLSFILIQALLMLTHTAWGGGRIDNIRLERAGDETRVTIYGDTPFKIAHSIEDARNSKPYRLVVDCRDMLFDLPQHAFREGLPAGVIKGIRTSQYQQTPERIVRVVLDLNGTVVYKVVETGDKNQAIIAISTPKEPDFTPWMAVKETGKETKEDKTAGLGVQTTATETQKVKTTADLGKTLKRGIGAVFGPERVAAHESDTLAPAVMTIQNPLQAELGTVPSRKWITYQPESRRDPFLPLTEREDMQFGEIPLPRFENLKLVGIISDSRGNQALLEDEIGFGYILKSGDRIKNGYVLSVEENKAVFQVEEYGGYKTMSLELNPEY